MEEIDLKQLLRMFWKKRVLIILCTLLGIIIGYVFNAFFTTPKYKATATFLLSNSENAEDSTITANEVTLNSKIINNYTELAKSDAVLDEVMTRLKMVTSKSELKNSISIKVKKDTEFVELSVTLADKENAATIANEIIKVLEEKVKTIYNMENLRIVDLAKTPVAPSNISPAKYAAIGGAIGLVIAIAITLILQMLDDSIGDVDELESKMNLPVLATFSVQNDPNTLEWNHKSDYVEGFKALRTNLQFSTESKGLHTIAVSSVFASEGKSWVTTNLAIAFAKADYNVLIIDADLRKGVQHQKFNVDQKPGLIQLIKKVENVEEFTDWKKYIKETKFNNIFVLPCGGNVTESSELLLSRKLSKIIRELKKGFDIIIFDSTPSALVTDAVVLSRLVDANVIVTEYEKTKYRDLKKMKSSILNVGGKITGVIINKVDRKESKKYYYYYGEEKNLTVSKHKR